MKSLVQILLLALFISCGSDDKSEILDIPADKVSASDMATPSDPGTADQGEMEDFMSDDMFMAKKSDTVSLKKIVSSASLAIGHDTAVRHMMLLEDGDESFEKCFSIDEIKLEASGDTIILKKAVDAASCLKPILSEQAGSQASINIPMASFGINMKIQCPGADLSSYNGKKFSEMDASSDEVSSVCDDGGAKFFVNLIGRIKYNMTLNENELEADANIKFIIASKEGDSCTLTAVTGGMKSDNCVHISGSVVNIVSNGESEVEREFQKIVFNDVVEPSDESALYYTSGTQTVTFRNWQGTVTHSGTGFTYDFSNGTANVEGTKGTVPPSLD